MGSRRLKREKQHEVIEVEEEEEDMKLSLVENVSVTNFFLLFFLTHFPQFETPEPQYTETKSSILRRRNSMAKLNNSGKFSEGTDRQPR